MIRDCVILLSGSRDLTLAISDLLSATHTVFTILLDQQGKQYDFRQEERSYILRGKVLIIDIPSIQNYSPLLLSYLKTINPKAPLILLHHYTSQVYANAFLRMGASAYLPTNFHPEKLLEAIDLVQEGQQYISLRNTE